MEQAETPASHEQPPQVTSKRRRWLRRVAIGVVVLLVVFVAALAAGSWYFSDLVLVPDHDPGPYNVKLEQFTPSGNGGSATFERTENSERPGYYLLQQAGGATARINEITKQDKSTVTRELEQVAGDLKPGQNVVFNSNYYSGDPKQALGVNFSGVSIQGDLGPMPAWLIPGKADTWLIFVHGHNASPQSGLKYVRAIQSVGLPSLLITYRNDVGAPPSPDGLLHLGATEWQDLDAAAKYALTHGAKKLVLFGASMGGAIVSQFLHESPRASKVSAVVFDAPVLNWSAVFSFQASERGMPQFLADTSEIVVSERIGIDFAEFDQIARAKSFKWPILLTHGEQDQVVPISTSEQFAAALPLTVQFHKVPEAAHVESWNVNPDRYDGWFKPFLRNNAPGAL